MIKFKTKNYTIREGQYTGPKNIEEIPGLVGTAIKGTLAGTAAGAVVGGIMKDTTAEDGAKVGAGTGLATSIAYKLLMNYVHKPMKTIKYYEIDKGIRRQFGIYQISGLVVGDSLDKRATVDERFSFGDRNVSNYKINIAIQNNKVTLYTFGVSDTELDDISKILDYYCKKFFSMNYISKLINQKTNSYSVDIVPTNYQALCNFIIEISKKLNSKINVLDNDTVVLPRISQEISDRESEDTGQEQKEFSVHSLNKYDIIKALSKGISKGFVKGYPIGVFTEIINSLSVNELRLSGAPRELYGNKFLENELIKLHYIEGHHYTTGNESNPIQISLISGIFVISANKEKSNELDKLYKSYQSKIKKSIIGDTDVYTYSLQNISEFEGILNKLISLGLKPNIYDPTMRAPKFKFFSLASDNLETNLKKDKIIDYEIADDISVDTITINSDLDNVIIYIPEEIDYVQYDIDNWIRKNLGYIRANQDYEGEYTTLSLNYPVTQAQYNNLVKFIIKNQGFCTILK